MANHILLTATIAFMVCIAIVESSPSGDEIVSPVGHRFPPKPMNTPSDTKPSTDNTCPAGALCAGPGRDYSLGRQEGGLFQSYFTVPDLPEKHDSTETTYYDYLNIYWGGFQPDGGYMNQLVPQLMLGNALANSTNYPHYKPKWIKLDTWHIGAQYFMATCPKKKDGTFDCKQDTWIPRAATGRLVPVEPGDIVETTIELVEWKWQLKMRVVGTGSSRGVNAAKPRRHRSSVVIADKPFMGLLESTTSWNESLYENIYVGSCLENYGMQSARNYPPSWEITVNILSPTARFTKWSDWHLSHRRNCNWQPQSSISSITGSMWQHAAWNATLQGRQDSKLSFSTTALRG